ncbi:MAG TPA: helix-turn-helix transcriptional regulator [Elusimicrobiales bacterium]|nr:helix-turn-helix transcriptional regulator [Elusimicrobiales bacterium]
MYNLHSKKYKEFVKKLIQARKDASLTQVEVAKKLKKPQSYISKCENGERRVDFTELVAFAKIYKKPLGYFKD